MITSRKQSLVSSICLGLFILYQCFPQKGLFRVKFVLAVSESGRLMPEALEPAIACTCPGTGRKYNQLMLMLI